MPRRWPLSPGPPPPSPGPLAPRELLQTPLIVGWDVGFARHKVFANWVSPRRHDAVRRDHMAGHQPCALQLQGQVSMGAMIFPWFGAF